MDATQNTGGYTQHNIQVRTCCPISGQLEVAGDFVNLVPEFVHVVVEEHAASPRGADTDHKDHLGVDCLVIVLLHGSFLEILRPLFCDAVQVGTNNDHWGARGS